MKLEYIGRPGPHRNVERFIAEVKRRRPQATDLQIERYVHTANARNRPRYDWEVFQLFGEDIMSNDVQSMEAWPYLSPEWKELLPQFPLEGEPFDESRGFTLTYLVNMKQVHLVPRRTLCVPPGLSRSYVWCPENDWIVDVKFEDAEIIRHRPDLRPRFRPVDNADNPQRLDRFQREVVGPKIVAKTKEEAEEIAKELGI